MQFDVKAVENIISSSPRKNGAFNLFFKLNDKIGIKLSNNKTQRDNNYHNQENAAKFGLGPDVYDMVDNVNYEGETYWGYFTEIVWVFEQVSGLDRYHRRFLLNAVKEQMETLCKELKEFCDYDFHDDHLGNLGIKDQKLVCIDFDEDDTEHVPFKSYY